MIPLAVIGIRVEKSLFGKCSKEDYDSLGARMADLMPFTPTRGRDLKNIYGEGYFKPYDVIELWNKTMHFSLHVLDAEKYCYNVELGQIVQTLSSEYALIFGYSMPYNHDEMDINIHDEHGQFVFHIPDGHNRKIIKLPPLAIDIPQDDEYFYNKYLAHLI
ncbi:MAG: hypothetical protein PHY48_11340 [Candidatus Cloacimonetes bacterium]|jgi:hypothetical protein|nr:hypothetical protein [Candidatus Cloacimonadota bacterium]